MFMKLKQTTFTNPDTCYILMLIPTFFWIRWGNNQSSAGVDFLLWPAGVKIMIRIVGEVCALLLSPPRDSAYCCRALISPSSLYLYENWKKYISWDKEGSIKNERQRQKGKSTLLPLTPWFVGKKYFQNEVVEGCFGVTGHEEIDKLLGTIFLYWSHCIVTMHSSPSSEFWRHLCPDKKPVFRVYPIVL